MSNVVKGGCRNPRDDLDVIAETRKDLRTEAEARNDLAVEAETRSALTVLGIAIGDC